MIRPSIAIIGAGIAGLSAARILQEAADVTVFDKSRGVGGRMSTRYARDYEFDHGAQYFTAQNADFKAAVDEAVAAGIVQPWLSRGLYLKDGTLVPDTGRARYVGAPRMNSWPKYLASGLDVKLNHRVSQITPDDNRWQLAFETGEALGGFDGVICTAPPAQAQNLLPPDFAQMAELKTAKLDACFALMIGLEDALSLPWDSLRVDTGPVAWLAVNSAKPERGASTALVVHADAAWSEAHQDADRTWVQEELIRQASQLCGHELSNAPHTALHRWLYASPGYSLDTLCLYDAKLSIAACGDWCLGGRVEGAWLSGRAAANAVLSRL